MTLKLNDSLVNLPLMTGEKALDHMVWLFGKEALLGALGHNERIAEAVVAEREACAERAEKEAASCRLAWKTAHHTWLPTAYEVKRWQFAAEVAEVIANGIRAREEG